MSKLRISIRRCAPVSCCVLLLTSFPGLSVGQSTNSVADDEAKQRITGIIRELDRSNYDATIGAQELPVLEDAFAQTTDPVLKENIASALVRLGGKDDIYWSVLAERAQEILDNDAPDPILYDANGKSIRGKLSPAFLEWASKHGLTSDAIYQQLLTIPAEFSFVATTGDSRGLPILRKGLQSSNYVIRAIAARGLATLQDEASIPLIIAAAHQAPSEIQGFIARALVAFSNPAAQAAAEELVTDKNVLEGIRQQIKERGPRGVW